MDNVFKIMADFIASAVLDIMEINANVSGSSTVEETTYPICLHVISSCLHAESLHQRWYM
jgi:hypothetical protein